MSITLDILETRAQEIGRESPEYFSMWFENLDNREWEPAQKDYLYKDVDADHLDMVIHDYDRQLFILAVIAAKEIA